MEDTENVHHFQDNRFKSAKDFQIVIRVAVWTKVIFLSLSSHVSSRCGKRNQVTTCSPSEY